jgi:hypothetical protein
VEALDLNNEWNNYFALTRGEFTKSDRDDRVGPAAICRAGASGARAEWLDWPRIIGKKSVY